jgi:heme exporter protein B
MLSIFQFEVKYYFKSLKEVIQLIGLFISIVLLYPFALAKAGTANQEVAVASLWVAFTVTTSIGSIHLFDRDHRSGRLEYYQLLTGGLSGVIFAKWAAYFLFITVPLAAIFPVVALLVDIPVGAWSHYGVGLISGVMALSILNSLVAALLTGLDKIGAALSLIALPLTIPIIIFGANYLNNGAELIQPGLIFLWGFSLLMLPVLCFAGASAIRASH